jgi:hypothetical protein
MDAGLSTPSRELGLVVVLLVGFMKIPLPLVALEDPRLVRTAQPERKIVRHPVTADSRGSELTGGDTIRRADARVFGASGFLYENSVFGDQIRGY